MPLPNKFYREERISIRDLEERINRNTNFTDITDHDALNIIKMYVDKFVRPSPLYKRFELGRKILNELLTKDSLLIAMKIRQLKENNCQYFVAHVTYERVEAPPGQSVPTYKDINIYYTME